MLSFRLQLRRQKPGCLAIYRVFKGFPIFEQGYTGITNSAKINADQNRKSFQNLASLQEKKGAGEKIYA